MDIWPDMVKRGVNIEEALNIIDSGLGDRVLVNILADYARENYGFLYDEEVLVDELRHSAEVNDFLMSKEIPLVLKERWQQYLRMNGGNKA